MSLLVAIIGIGFIVFGFTTPEVSVPVIVVGALLIFGGMMSYAFGSSDNDRL